MRLIKKFLNLFKPKDEQLIQQMASHLYPWTKDYLDYLFILKDDGDQSATIILKQLYSLTISLAKHSPIDFDSTSIFEGLKLESVDISACDFEEIKDVLPFLKHFVLIFAPKKRLRYFQAFGTWNCVSNEQNTIAFFRPLLKTHQLRYFRNDLGLSSIQVFESLGVKAGVIAKCFTDNANRKEFQMPYPEGSNEQLCYNYALSGLFESISSLSGFASIAEQWTAYRDLSIINIDQFKRAIFLLPFIHYERIVVIPGKYKARKHELCKWIDFGSYKIRMTDRNLGPSEVEAISEIPNFNLLALLHFIGYDDATIELGVRQIIEFGTIKDALLEKIIKKDIAQVWALLDDLPAYKFAQDSLTHIKQLKKICLNNKSIHFLPFCLRYAKKLRAIHFEKCSIKNNLEGLEGYSNFRVLRLVKTKVNDLNALLVGLKQAELLERLELVDLNLAEIDFSNLPALSKLRRLSFAYCQNLNYADFLPYLNRLHKIKQLDLSSCQLNNFTSFDGVPSQLEWICAYDINAQPVSFEQEQKKLRVDIYHKANDKMRLLEKGEERVNALIDVLLDDPDKAEQYNNYEVLRFLEREIIKLANQYGIFNKSSLKEWVEYLNRSSYDKSYSRKDISLKSENQFFCVFRLIKTWSKIIIWDDILDDIFDPKEKNWKYLTQCTSLTLYDHNVVYFPKELKEFTKLSELHISSSRFDWEKGVPFLMNFKYLNTISISNNSKLPATFTQLQGLTTIILSVDENYDWAYFFSLLKEMPKVTNIDFGLSPITHFPEIFWDLPNFTKISGLSVDLSERDMKRLKQKAFYCEVRKVS